MILFLAFSLTFLANGPIPEDQLVTRVGDKEVFAPAFRGTWSKSASDCSDESSLKTVVISEARLEGYGWDTVLLKTTPVIGQSGSKKGEWANTVVVLTADRAETEVSFGKRRLSLLGGKLYMSNAEAVAEEDHFGAEFANVRCP